MTDQIERELVLPAPPEQVWGVITGWVEEADPPERLVFWWGDDGEPATRVELTLEPEGDDRTRLRVVESRPLEVLDVTGIPLPRGGSSSYGPAMVAAA
jgi:uncharacterized protein YndB with AHSA1/START domain